MCKTLDLSDNRGGQIRKENRFFKNFIPLKNDMFYFFHQIIPNKTCSIRWYMFEIEKIISCMTYNLIKLVGQFRKSGANSERRAIWNCNVLLRIAECFNLDHFATGYLRRDKLLLPWFALKPDHFFTDHGSFFETLFFWRKKVSV